MFVGCKKVIFFYLSFMLERNESIEFEWYHVCICKNRIDKYIVKVANGCMTENLHVGASIIIKAKQTCLSIAVSTFTRLEIVLNQCKLQK